MYQLEVKYHLVRHLFPPSEGWTVTVDIDAMERAKGPQHKPDKKGKVRKAEASLVNLGATIGSHKLHGRVDVSASHPEKGNYLIEVEGASSKQKEQAMYSAIGQTILIMDSQNNRNIYALAVPDTPEWEKQIVKIPSRVKSLLNLKCLWCRKMVYVKYRHNNRVNSDGSSPTLPGFFPLLPPFFPNGGDKLLRGDAKPEGQQYNGG